MNVENDLPLIEYANYDFYLDTFLNKNDVRYLPNFHYGRILVKLGYRSATDVYTPQQFLVRKQAGFDSLHPTKKSIKFYSTGLTLNDPVLKELAERETPNFQKTVSTIIFCTQRIRGGYEVSAYIDFAQSLQMCNLQSEGGLDWAQIFAGKKCIKPQPTDLSYFNGRTGTVITNNSDNYNVINDPEYGLLFKYKGDRKLICVNPSQNKFIENSFRNMIHSEKLGHVILYDHIIRKKV